MAWTTPRTWVSGELVTASIMNLHVRDNLNALRDGSKLTLLKSNSNSNTGAGTVDLDTYAMASGLTALDRLLFIGCFHSATQATANIQLYNLTDGVQIAGFTASLAANATMNGECKIQRYTTSTVKVGAYALLSTGNASTDSTFTTPYTGNWTFSIRHTGVTAGGTLYWSYGLFVIRGQ